MFLQSRCAGCDRPGFDLCRTCRLALLAAPAPSLIGAHGRCDRGSSPALVDSSSGARVPVVAAVRFTGRARDVVLGFKYRNRREVAGHLAGLLVNRLLAEGVRPGIDVDVVTWAPTSPRRRRRRGIDQAELVARHVAAQLGLRCRRLLEREAGQAQTGRGRIERMEGPAFRARPGLDGRRVLVVDDVVTTGATLRRASGALLDAGAESVVLGAIAATPSGLGARRERWGQVVVGPWSADQAESARTSDRTSTDRLVGTTRRSATAAHRRQHRRSA